MITLIGHSGSHTNRISLIVKELGAKIPFEHLIHIINMYEDWELKKSKKTFAIQEYVKVREFTGSDEYFTSFNLIKRYHYVPKFLITESCDKLIQEISKFTGKPLPKNLRDCRATWDLGASPMRGELTFNITFTGV